MIKSGCSVGVGSDNREDQRGVIMLDNMYGDISIVWTAIILYIHGRMTS